MLLKEHSGLLAISHLVEEEAMKVREGKKASYAKLGFKITKAFVLDVWKKLGHTDLGKTQPAALFSIRISFDFLIPPSWPAIFWEHIVHMFRCRLKPLRETGVD